MLRFKNEGLRCVRSSTMRALKDDCCRHRMRPGRGILNTRPCFASFSGSSSFLHPQVELFSNTRREYISGVSCDSSCSDLEVLEVGNDLPQRTLRFTKENRILIRSALLHPARSSNCLKKNLST